MPNPVNVQLLLLVAYSALLVAVGVWIGRRVGSAQQFFVAGRSLGPWLLGATLLAANIGAGSTVGAASLGYEYGFSAWWWGRLCRHRHPVAGRVDWTQNLARGA